MFWLPPIRLPHDMMHRQQGAGMHSEGGRSGFICHLFNEQGALQCPISSARDYE